VSGGFALVFGEDFERMRRLPEMKMIIATLTLLGGLAACQTNTAGKPGYVPHTCAAPGSSCSGR
jgi:hypothetical protein